MAQFEELPVLGFPYFPIKRFCRFTTDRPLWDVCDYKSSPLTSKNIA